MKLFHSRLNETNQALIFRLQVNLKRKENFCSINVDQLFQTETIQLASEKQIENNFPWIEGEKPGFWYETVFTSILGLNFGPPISSETEQNS